MFKDPEVLHAVHQFQLGLPRMPSSGRTGELLGRGAGSSLEFQEYREYMPGDDIRHLDWGAYARSDALMVRLFREEISPRTEIILDGSRSMLSAGDIKGKLARQLAAVFALLAGGLGAQARIWIVNDSPRIEPIGINSLDLLDRVPFDGVSTLGSALAERRMALKRQGVRIVISDFLFPHDPESLLKQLGAEASTLWVVQLLGSWEAAPTPIGGRKLLDAESGAEIDLMLDRRTIAAYTERLGRLEQELARNCRRLHATYVKLIAEKGLAALCRDDLCASGILRAG